MGGCMSRRAAADAAADAPTKPPPAAQSPAAASPFAAREQQQQQQQQQQGGSLNLSSLYGFDPSVASSSFDYAAYAAALVANGGSPGASSTSRHRRFRRRHHDHDKPCGGSSSGNSADGGSLFRGGSASSLAAQQQQQQQSPPLGLSPSPYGPRPDVTRPLAKSLLGKTHPDDVAALFPAVPGAVLGRGQFGVAREATCARTGEKVAVKTIKKSRVRGLEHLVDVRREVEVLRHLSPHPRIVRLIDALEDDTAVHLVMELCRGGELVDAVSAAGKFTEADAAAAMRSLLEGVAYCHELGVVHRDLKLDNLLIPDGPEEEEEGEERAAGGAGAGANAQSLVNARGNASGNSNATTTTRRASSTGSSLSTRVSAIKTSDFGLSSFAREGEHLRGLCGTAFYVAPEILAERPYCGRAADVWACGVILYIMLAGVPPYYAERDEEVFAQILGEAEPSFGSRAWDSVSTPAIEAVRRMMRRDPSQRPAAAEMLRDPWIREGGLASADRPMQPEVLRRMRAFARHNRLRREAMLLVAEAMPPEEIAGLTTLFREFDADGDGLITPAELREGLLRKGQSAVPAEALARVVALADIDHDQRLSVDEFVASTLDVCRAGLRQRLEAAFARFDRDGDGYATREEVKAALAALQGRRKARSQRRLLGAGSSAGGAGGGPSSSVGSSTTGGGGPGARVSEEGGEEHGQEEDEGMGMELTRAERAVLNADVDAIFAEADADGDGRISRSEFFAMMERPLDAAEDDLLGPAPPLGAEHEAGGGGEGRGDGRGGAAAGHVGGGGGKARPCDRASLGINRRSLAAARRAVEKMKEQQQQQAAAAGAVPPPPLQPVRAH